MYMRILTGRTLANPLRLVIPLLLLVLAGGAFNAGAQTETNLYFFGSSSTAGNGPRSGLVQANDGNFYGTTPYGGMNSCNCGTVFRIGPNGTYTNLYSFGGSLSDGEWPYAGLVQGSDGNFYGTTQIGGTNSCNCGTVFRISPSGTYTDLYSFVGPPRDGKYPFAGLVQGSDGNFYGTTYEGGTTGHGTVFRINLSGSYTNLYSFGGYPNDGRSPFAGLVQGSDGDFYGTTWMGGTSNNGTIFRISPSGSETNLYSFVGSPTDGYNPYAGLVQGSDGNFYGTTVYGGTSSKGTIFRINPSGTYTSLYSFAGSPNDGEEPYAELVQGSDGNFYGTTWIGGTNNDGTIFRVSLSGNETNLYSFVGPPSDGGLSSGGIVQGSDGNFYGTTYWGGTSSNGTVFKLTVPLKPPPYPINQITGVHVTGAKIVFNIPSIAGETYQLQFSSSMNPTNWVNVPAVSVTNSIGAMLTVTNFGGALGSQGFYRFAITP